MVIVDVQVALDLDSMSMSECRESWSSMWSKKPTPVEILAAPVPSRLTATETEVSLVLREMLPMRRIIVSPIRVRSMPWSGVPYQAVG
jgi:hypothetical protein